MIFSVQVAEIPKNSIKLDTTAKILDQNCRSQEHFVNKTAHLRKCLRTFSRIVEFGAVQTSASQAFIFWITAVPTSTVRAACPVHLLFSFLFFRCIAAVWWLLLRGCVLRPLDACQKRFSWFFYRIPKVQKCVNLVDLVKSFRIR